MEKELEEKGIIHTLGEIIGYEEAELYWDILNSKDISNINKSRKYRVLYSLFEKGLLLKVKQRGLFHYIPFPPNFLQYTYNIKSKLLVKKEQEYRSKYLPIILEKDSFFEANGTMIDYFLIFMIKNMMRKEVKLLIGGQPIYTILQETFPEIFDKTNFIGIKEFFGKNGGYPNIKLIPKNIISEKRFCIIDNSILIVFLKTINNIYFGYITLQESLIEEKKEEFNFLKSF